MTNIESISILRQTDRLDKVSQNSDPLFITKNGKAYLVILSPEHYEQIVKELEHYKQAFDREREIKELAAKVEKSRQNIKNKEHYSEAEFEKEMDKILS